MAVVINSEMVLLSIIAVWALSQLLCPSYKINPKKKPRFCIMVVLASTPSAVLHNSSLFNLSLSSHRIYRRSLPPPSLHSLLVSHNPPGYCNLRFLPCPFLTTSQSSSLYYPAATSSKSSANNISIF